MTDTIMLEAPARGGRISDLADGQGRMRAAASFVTMGNTSTQPCRMAPGGHRRRTHHH